MIKLYVRECLEHGTVWGIRYFWEKGYGPMIGYRTKIDDYLFGKDDIFVKSEYKEFIWDYVGEL